MPYQPFTSDEVRTIFTRSEQRAPGLGTGGVGHAGAKHVGITNQGLSDRLRDARGSGLAVYTAFLSFADQVAAALEFLNLSTNDRDLERFRVAIRPGERFAMDHRAVPTPVRMRYALGDGAATFPCTTFSLWLRKDLTRPRGMHVVTFFGTMGRPI